MSDGQEPFDFSGMAELGNCREEAPEPEILPPADWSEAEKRLFPDQLLLNIHRGILTKEEAYEEVFDPARAVFRPNLDFSPAELLRWSLEMTAAWIIWRDSAAVLRHVKRHYHGASVWVRSDKEFSPSRGRFRLRNTERSAPPYDWRPGHDLHDFCPTSIWSGFFDFDGEPRSFLPFEDWFAPLRGLLAEEIIKARGTPLKGKAGKPYIPAGLWELAKFERSGARGTILKVNGVDRYEDITFSAREITRLFPQEEAQCAPVDEMTTHCYTSPRATGFYRWREAEEKAKFNRPSHRHLYSMLRKESPDGFPDVGGSLKVSSNLVRRFIACMEPGPDGKGSAFIAQIGNDNNFQQNIIRFIRQRFFFEERTAVAPRLGSRMLAAIEARE